MRATLVKCAVLGCVLALASTAQATRQQTGRPPSKSAEMNRIIGTLCSMELGNGAYAFRRYDPTTYRRKDAVALIKRDMQNFEHSGVRFKTATGATRVKAQLQKALGGMADESVATLTSAIDGLKRLGVLQDVVYRGLSGGKAVGDTYFSIPHQVFFCIKTPTQRGKRLEVFLEYGD